MHNAKYRWRGGRGLSLDAPRSQNVPEQRWRDKNKGIAMIEKTTKQSQSQREMEMEIRQTTQTSSDHGPKKLANNTHLRHKLLLQHQGLLRAMHLDRQLPHVERRVRAFLFPSQPHQPIDQRAKLARHQTTIDGGDVRRGRGRGTDHREGLHLCIRISVDAGRRTIGDVRCWAWVLGRP